MLVIFLMFFALALISGPLETNEWQAHAQGIDFQKCSLCHDIEYISAFSFSTHKYIGLTCGNCHVYEARHYPPDLKICLKCHSNLHEAKNLIEAKTEVQRLNEQISTKKSLFSYSLEIGFTAGLFIGLYLGSKIYAKRRKNKVEMGEVVKVRPYNTR